MGTSELDGSFESFQAMRLLPDVVRGLNRAGCKKPTTIQQETIVPILYHRDVIVEASIGSGSTTAYGAAVLHLCDPRSDFVQAVIITSSYRYADQIHSVLRRLAHYVSLRMHVCGSGNTSEQERDDIAAAPIHIVIGSASAVHRMAHDGLIHISKATVCIVDKTNDLFARNLSDSLVSISRYISSRAQYAFFSETMPKQMDAFVAKLGLKCTWINLRSKQVVSAAKVKKEVSMDGIKHLYLLDEDYKVFHQLQQLLPISPVIIYAGSRGRVETFASALRASCPNIGALTEVSTPTERGIVLQQYRAGIIRTVVVSDAILAETDLVQSPLIINIGLPDLAERYADRVCRPDRNNKHSVVVNIIKPSELAVLGSIEERYSIIIEELPMTEEEVEIEDEEEQVTVHIPVPDLAPAAEAEPCPMVIVESDEEPDGLFTM